MGMGAQHHTPTALPLGKTNYPLYRWLGWTQGLSGLVRKISPPAGFDPQTVQPYLLAVCICNWGFCYKTPCGLVRVYQRVRETYCHRIWV